MQYTDQDVQQVMDFQKCNRIKAIHLIKRLGGVEKAVAFVKAAPVSPAAKPEVDPKATHEAHAGKKTMKVAKPKHVKHDLPKTNTEIVKESRETLDDVIRAALRSAYKKVCPVIAILGQRFTEPSQTSGYPFYRVLADTPDGLQVVFVAGFYKGGPGPSASIKPAVKSSPTVKQALARIARATKRAAERLEREPK
jgi:hypothetical protein